MMDICVVLVTYNRREELRKTLSLYENQTYAPRAVLVVDNHSTDGTGQMLEEWRKSEGAIRHTVCTLPQNEGGSGGFWRGMREALDMPYTWIFVSDDDAAPRADALERLNEFAKKHEKLVSECSAICGAVDMGNGGFATGHRARINRRSLTGIIDTPVPEEEYGKEYFDIDFFSYIGTCFRRSALERSGLPRREFFIYSDDFEHSLRVGRVGRMICVPSVLLCHSDNNSYSPEASWRDYYATRNLLIMYREHFGRIAAARRALLRRLTALRSGNAEKIKVIGAGIKDAKKGITGLHSVYRPGWQPNKK